MKLFFGSSSYLFQPKLLGCNIPGVVECDLLSLPVRFDDLGLFILTVTAARKHACSPHTSSPLVDLIVSQIYNVTSCFVNQVHLHSEVFVTQKKDLQKFANSVYDQLPPELQSSVELACEKGLLTGFLVF